MMHGRGESDSAIVAGKPTNKAERSAAEPVEPRAEAEGNASQQSTGRAQSRGTVSQALETKPARVHELGKVYQHHQPLLSVHQDTTPAALSPFRRQNPRDEPGALAAHAGIRAGGAQQ